MEERARRGTNRLRVVHVDGRIGEHDGIGSCRIGGPKDRARVPRIPDRVQNGNKLRASWNLADGHVDKPSHRQDALWSHGGREVDHDLLGDGDRLDAALLRSGNERMGHAFRRRNVEESLDRPGIESLCGGLRSLGQETPLLLPESPLLKSCGRSNVSVRRAGDDGLAGPLSPVSLSGAHSRRQLGAEPSPSDLDEPGEAGWVRRSDVGEDFPVEIDVRRLQPADER